MPIETLLGALVVAAAGLIMGSGAWPFKLMRRFQFEHWWFVGMLVGLIIMPWTITLLGCPNALEALRNVPISAIVLGNLFALGWGIANVLCGLCYVRIGVASDGCHPRRPGRIRGGDRPVGVQGIGPVPGGPQPELACRHCRPCGSEHHTRRGRDGIPRRLWP